MIEVHCQLQPTPKPTVKPTSTKPSLKPTTQKAYFEANNKAAYYDASKKPTSKYLLRPNRTSSRGGGRGIKIRNTKIAFNDVI
jgi:hypothetical protein